MATDGRITLTAVAARAGVSVATASRALRDRGEMSADTRARVRRAASALGYTGAPTGAGRPRRGTSLMFDLVLGSFHDPYTEELTAGARTAASALGYDLVLTAEREDPSDDWPDRIRSRGSAGVLAGLIVPTSAQTLAMRRAGIPLVLMEPPGEASYPLPSVQTTDRAGATTAAEHLIARGARRFVVIGGVPSYRFGRARLEGFIAALTQLAPDAPYVTTRADWTAWGARRVCTRALADLGGEGPIGIFACSDEMAAGAYRAVADRGLTIPGDVRVVGFDDVRGARWLHPSLTTIRQPIREMAATAVQLLARAADGEDVAPDAIIMPTELVPRGSTSAQ